MTSKIEETAARCERASEILAAAAILCVLLFHLVPALFAGFLAHMLLKGVARRLRGGRVSHGAARALAVSLLGLIAAGVVVGAALLLHGFVRGRLGDLPGLLASVGKTLRSLLSSLEGLGFPLPAYAGDDDTSKAAWISRHSAELSHAGIIGLRGLVHALVGAVLGVLVFFRAPEKLDTPLGAALANRISRFDAAFRSVAKAQLEISAVNTVLTGLYLFVALPLFGTRVPLAGTLVALTFLCGLLPIIGNLVSNAFVVLLSLGVSPWVAVSSVVFLVVIHKLEYLLNAKIVGARIGAAVWETLIAMILLDAIFGVSGLILAPVVYAWLKAELVERGLV
ncbi:MAG TPA: AI-2E family transporter [Thermoanaerobaculia bacterium]